MAKTDQFIRADVVTMYDAGVKDVRQIAAEVGISADTVRKILRDAGFELKRGGMSQSDKMSPEQIDEFLTDYRGGKPNRVIAAKFGLPNVQAIYNILAQLNEPPRSLKGPTLESRKAAMEHALSLYQERPELTIWEIIDETGVNQVTLHQEIHRRGIPLRRPHRQSEDD